MISFEIYLFVYIIAPQNSQKIDEWLADHKLMLYSVVDPNMIQQFQNMIGSKSNDFNVLVIRENELITKLNTSLINTVVVILVMIIVIFFGLLVHIKRYLVDILNITSNVIYANVICVPIVTAFVTLLLLGYFQYILYNFATKFRYISSEELQYEISKKILQEMT
jgi:hypothetical protein